MPYTVTKIRPGYYAVRDPKGFIRMAAIDRTHYAMGPKKAVQAEVDRLNDEAELKAAIAAAHAINEAAS